jgi:hypothetical protein
LSHFYGLCDPHFQPRRPPNVALDPPDAGSKPFSDRRLGAIPDGAGRLPLPFLAIELIRGQGIEEQFIVDGWTGSAGCFFPALARPMVWRDYEMTILDPQLYGVLEAALFENWLGDSDASRIADTHEFNLHRRQTPRT